MKHTFNPNNHRLEELGLHVVEHLYTQAIATYGVRNNHTQIAKIYTVPLNDHMVTRLECKPRCKKGKIRPQHAPILKLRYYLATGRIPNDLTWEVLLAQARQERNGLAAMTRLINKAGRV